MRSTRMTGFSATARANRAFLRSAADGPGQLVSRLMDGQRGQATRRVLAPHAWSGGRPGPGAVPDPATVHEPAAALLADRAAAGNMILHWVSGKTPVLLGISETRESWRARSAAGARYSWKA